MAAPWAAPRPLSTLQPQPLPTQPEEAEEEASDEQAASHMYGGLWGGFSRFSCGAPESEAYEAGPSGREREGPSPVLALGVLADCARACSCCRLLAHLFNIRSIDIEPPQIPTPNRPPKQKAKGMWWACGMWGCRASALLSSAVQRERRTRERAVHTPHYLNLPSVFCRRF